MFFVLLAESTIFCNIQKTYTYTSVCDIALAVRTFIAEESPRTLEDEIFTRTKIYALAVVLLFQWGLLVHNGIYKTGACCRFSLINYMDISLEQHATTTD